MSEDASLGLTAPQRRLDLISESEHQRLVLLGQDRSALLLDDAIVDEVPSTGDGVRPGESCQRICQRTGHHGDIRASIPARNIAQAYGRLVLIPYLEP